MKVTINTATGIGTTIKQVQSMWTDDVGFTRVNFRTRDAFDTALTRLLIWEIIVEDSDPRAREILIKRGLPRIAAHH